MHDTAPARCQVLGDRGIVRPAGGLTRGVGAAMPSAGLTRAHITLTSTAAPVGGEQ